MKNTLLSLMREAASRRSPCIVALDGRCASGKSTLAAALAAELGCPLVHVDDFFLPPAKRTPARLAEVGGNMDRERLRDEVLVPLGQGREAVFRPFSCALWDFAEPVTVPAAPLVLVEGSYACHPDLREHYGLCLFLTVDPAEQARRILARNGPRLAAQFRDRWIPMEEAYFEAFAIPATCDWVGDTTHPAPRP